MTQAPSHNHTANPHGGSQALPVFPRLALNTDSGVLYSSE